MALNGRPTKPVIGVSGPDRGGTVAWLFSRFAVWLAGGKARRITPAKAVDIEELDGLILGGGADVEPRRYGKLPDKILPDPGDARRSLKGRMIYTLSVLLFPLIFLLRKLFSLKAVLPYDQGRDKLEFDLLEKALRRGIPLLGICRGAQLINIHFGGSLYQTIKGFYVETPEVRSILPRKRIFLCSSSKLGTIMKTDSCKVNALHNQAIENLGEGVVPVAWESNKLVQAIEHHSQPYILGVQWHPEYLPQQSRQRSIFKFLVNAANLLKQKKLPC